MLAGISINLICCRKLTALSPAAGHGQPLQPGKASVTSIQYTKDKALCVFFWKCRREGEVDRGCRDVIHLAGKRKITAELFPRKEFRNQTQHKGKMSRVGWELTILSCVETLTFSDIMSFFFFFQATKHRQCVQELPKLA